MKKTLSALLAFLLLIGIATMFNLMASAAEIVTVTFTTRFLYSSDVQEQLAAAGIGENEAYQAAFSSEVVHIGEYAFSGDTRLAGVTFSENIEGIGREAFHNCSGLTAIVLPDSRHTTIWPGAFSGCTNLNSIHIGTGVTQFPSDFFDGCFNVSNVTVSENHSTFSAVENVLFSDDGTFLAYCSKTKSGTYVVPDSVLVLGERAFYHCQNLTSVIIPDSVTDLGLFLFKDCTALTNVQIGIGVEEISSGIFSGCTGLKESSIPNTSSRIGGWAFKNCSNLEKVTIPDSVEWMDLYAFEGCDKLTIYASRGSTGHQFAKKKGFAWVEHNEPPADPVNVSIWPEEQLLPVGRTAQLTALVHPASSTDPSVTWSSSRPDIVSVSAEGQVEAKAVGTAVITAKTNTGGKIATRNVTVKKAVTFTFKTSGASEILSKNGAWNQWWSAGLSYDDLLIAKFDSSVKGLGEGAFEALGNLCAVDLPESLTHIDKGAFQFCKWLVTVTIPRNISSIHGSAFDDCASLTSIIVDKDNPNYMDEDGVLFDKSQETLIRYPGGKVGASYTIPDGVETVGESAFYYSADLTNVTIPESVTQIKEHAFYGLDQMASIVIPNSVTSIDEHVFYDLHGFVIWSLEDAYARTYAQEMGILWKDLFPFISVTLPQNTYTLPVKSTLQLTPTVLPEETADKSLSYRSSNPAVVTVSDSGLITAIAAGAAAITVRSNLGKTVTCQITVTQPVSRISLSQSTLSLNTGASSTLTATVSPANATNQSVIWSSGNPSVASVSSDGKVTAKKAGTAIITVKTVDFGKTATCEVTVTQPVTSVSISNAPGNMIMGKTATLKATVSPSNASDKAVTWKSSDAKVIMVEKSTGKVTAKGAGTAKITATAGGKSKTVTITVHSYVTLRLNKTTAIQNGTKITIDSQGSKPFIISGKTMVPMRFVAEKMGGKVSYKTDTQPIVMTYGDRKVELRLNSKEMKVTIGGKTTKVTLEVAAQTKNGRTYIPLRAISQALGFTVYYDAGTEIIVVNNPSMSTAIRNERIAEGKKVIK